MKTHGVGRLSAAALASCLLSSCGLIVQYTAVGWQAESTQTRKDVVAGDQTAAQHYDADVTLETPSVWALAIGAGAELVAANVLRAIAVDDRGKVSTAPAVASFGLGVAGSIDVIATVLHAVLGDTVVKKVALKSTVSPSAAPSK